MEHSTLCLLSHWSRQQPCDEDKFVVDDDDVDRKEDPE